MFQDHGPVITSQQVERLKQHTPLERNVIRFPQRSAKHEGRHDCARRTRLFNLGQYRGYYGCRQASFFQQMCQRAHGARTHGSDRGQYYGIDAIRMHGGSHALRRINHRCRIG